MLVNKVYLAWRKSDGERRHLIGEIYRHNRFYYTFQYLDEGVKAAKGQGFINYPEFPDTSSSILYKEEIKKIFSLRLIPEGRSDRLGFLAFWEANNEKFDWLDELALTQGVLPTDNFEFLGVYNPPKVKSFVTDLASVKRNDLEQNSISFFNHLDYQIEDSSFDETGKAVKVTYKGRDVGYIKKVHNRYFIEAEKKKLKPIIEVKDIDQNGKIKGIYVKVYVL